jgi:exosortase B
MYVPTYYTFANTVWNTEEQAHGPLILAVVLYLMWQRRYDVVGDALSRPLPVFGGLVMLFGLLLYVVGRSQDILMFDIGSQIPVLMGILLITHGISALKVLWFPLLYLAFMIPLPGFFVDAVTGPLKQHVSEVAEAALYQAGYPIARSGVMLTLGQYELLVADACSGLNSMFSLSAMGVLYLYLTRSASWLRNGIIIASIIPVAFFANVARVISLVLVTYYLGDAAGQGFLHGFAGILVFLVSLMFLFTLDRALGRFGVDRSGAGSR